MNKSEQLHLLRSLSTIRAGCIEYLNISHSLIPYDIIAEVLQSELEGKELSVKQLFSKLPYSDMGIRYHIRKLTTEDWIETNPTKKDHRVKTIHSKEKLRVQFELLRESLVSVLSLDLSPKAPQLSLPLTLI
jgi:hypothetical protein